MVKWEGGASAYAPKSSNGVAAPEPLPGLPTLPLQFGQGSGRGVFSAKGDAKNTKRDISAVRHWPSDCGRNVAGMKMRERGEKETLAGNALRTNGSALSFPGDSERPEPSRKCLFEQDESSKWKQGEREALVGDTLDTLVSRDNWLALSLSGDSGKALPRRSVSSVRQWPAVCGRNVTRLGREECLRHLADRKESLYGAIKNSEEKPDKDLSGSTLLLEKSRIPTKMVEVGDRRLEVRTEIGTQKPVEVQSQIDRSQFNDQNQMFTGMTNAARKKMLAKAPNGRAILHSKASSQSSELFGDLDSTLAVTMDKGKQKHVEVDVQIQLIASREAQLQQLKAGRQRSNDSQRKLPPFKLKLKPVGDQSKMNRSEFKDQNQMSNRMVNAARKKMLAKAPNGGATSHLKASSQSSEPFGNLDSTLAMIIDEDMQKHVDLTSNEAQLQPLEAERRRSSDSQRKLPPISPNLKSSTKMSSREDREIVLALQAAPNCPWKPGKRHSRAEDYVSRFAYKKSKRAASQIYFPT